MSPYSSNNSQNLEANSDSWYCLQSPSATAKQTNSALASPALSSPSLSLDNRGLAYADGFFTTMAITDGKILWADYHWQRLASHARALQLDIPKPSLLSELNCYAKQLQQGVMKVIITRATQSVRGYGFCTNAEGSACEIWLKIMPANKQTISQPIHQATLRLANDCKITLQPPTTAICLTSQLAWLPPTLAGLKTLNRLDNVLASGELQRLKMSAVSSLADTSVIGEGLVRDMTGNWVEGTMSNVFYQLSTLTTASDYIQNNAIKNNAHYLTSGQWYTPPMTQSGVAGVMRQVIIDSLSNTENPVIIRSLPDEDLPKLSQLFFCNAVRGIMPVTALTLLLGEVVEFN